MRFQGIFTRTPIRHAAGLKKFLYVIVRLMPQATLGSTVAGQGTGRTPYGSMSQGNSSGSFDSASTILGGRGIAWRSAQDDTGKGRRGTTIERKTCSNLYLI